jgi:hypothetical protein
MTSARLSPIPRRPAGRSWWLQRRHNLADELSCAVFGHDQPTARRGLTVALASDRLQGKRHAAKRLALDSNVLENAVHQNLRDRKRLVNRRVVFLWHSNSRISHNGIVTRPPRCRLTESFLSHPGQVWDLTLLRVPRGQVQETQPYQPQVERRSDCIRSASCRARQLQLAECAE